MKKVSFVIPCYCSAHTIAAVVAEIAAAMEPLPYAYETILVNDCSPDGTYDAICALAETYPNITGLSLARNFGQHAALMAGFHRAGGDIIVCLDDDGQTPADEVGKLLAQIEAGSDAVYAHYAHKQHAAFRNWGSRVNSRMAEHLLGKPRALTVSSYFAMRRFVMEEMLRYEHSYPYVIGLVLRATKNIANVTVQHRARQAGASGYTLGKLIALWVNGFTSFSVKPLRMTAYLGGLSILSGFLYLIYAIAAGAQAAWSAVIVLLLLLGGSILLALGLLGEYIGRIYMCINASPQYVVRETVTSDERARV